MGNGCRVYLRVRRERDDLWPIHPKNSEILKAVTSPRTPNQTKPRLFKVCLAASKVAEPESCRVGPGRVTRWWAVANRLIHEQHPVFASSLIQ